MLSICHKLVVPTCLGMLLLLVGRFILTAIAAGPQLQTTAPTILTPSDLPTITQLQATIQTLEAATDAAIPDRAKALESYRLALSRLQKARHDTEFAQVYQQTLQSAPAETARIRHLLDTAAKPTLPPIDPKASVDSLTRQLADVQEQLLIRQEQQTELEQQQTALQTRPEGIQKELADTKAELARLEQALQTVPSPQPSSLVAQAERIALLAQRRAQNSHIAMLQIEQQSANSRQALLSAQRDIVDRQLHEVQARVTELQTLINQRRLLEASQVAQQTAQTAEQAARQPAIIRQAAADNAALSQQLTILAERIEQATSEQTVLNQQLTQVNNSYRNAQQQLAIIGLSNALGPVLHGERRQLPDPRQYQHGSKERRQRLETARIQQFRIVQEYRKLRNTEAYIDQIMTQQAPEQLSQDQRQAIVSELRPLLAERLQLFDKLRTSYASYISLLVALHQAHQQFRTQASQYAVFLDENLIWLASVPPLDGSWLRRLPPALAWLVSPARWIEATRQLWQAMIRFLFPTLVVLLAWGGLVGRQRQMTQWLTEIGKRVWLITTDNFRQTLAALFLTLLLAFRWPLLIGWLGWLLPLSSGSNEFVRALGVAGIAVAATLFLINLLIELCADQGLAERHFHWSNAARSVCRQNLSWFRPLVLPMVLIIMLTEWQPEDIYRDTLGRLAFVIVSVALAILIWRVFRPRYGMQAALLAGPRSLTWRRLYILWYPLAIASPLILMVLAARGYYVTAVQLESRVVSSGLLLIGAVMVVNLVIRWLNVVERQLSVQRTRAKRQVAQAVQATKAAAAAGGEGMPETLQVPEIDLQTISENARRLLYLQVSIGVGIGLWLIWADVLPALHMLNDIALWQHTSIQNGKEIVQTFTLWSLLLAVFIGSFTLALARNFPGALEIGVLQRLAIEPGDRYAITTISRYVIMTVGLSILLNLVGIGWSQVQWLVAALGIGLGFGLQEIFANFVSGLIILAERPIRVGDTVTVGNFSGTVTHMRIRATTITDWDRKEVVVPNKLFLTDTLVNWTLSDPITRLIISVGVAYGSDPALVQRVLLEVADANPLVLEEPAPVVLFLAFGESSLNFEVRVFVRELTNRFPLIHQLHMAIERTFREHHIEIPFPQRDIHIRYSDVIPRPVETDTMATSQSV